MTTSNPEVPQPAGAADPQGEDHDRTVDPLLQETLEGAVPDEQTGGEPGAAEEAGNPADPEADSVDDDRKAAGG